MPKAWVVGATCFVVGAVTASGAFTAFPSKKTAPEATPVVTPEPSLDENALAKANANLTASLHECDRRLAELGERPVGTQAPAPSAAPSADQGRRRNRGPLTTEGAGAQSRSPHADENGDKGRRCGARIFTTETRKRGTRRGDWVRSTRVGPRCPHRVDVGVDVPPPRSPTSRRLTPSRHSHSSLELRRMAATHRAFLGRSRSDTLARSAPHAGHEVGGVDGDCALGAA
jgi:hypothetical protein